MLSIEQQDVSRPATARPTTWPVPVTTTGIVPLSSQKPDGTILFICNVCGRVRSEDILREIGLEASDLFPEPCNGYFAWDDIDVSPGGALGGLDASEKRLYRALKEHSQTLPDGPSRAGWEQALRIEEFKSLVWLVKERFSRRSNNGDLDFEAMLYAAFEAAVGAYVKSQGGFDPRRGKLTTYARPSIRGAIRDEVRPQSGKEEELPLEEELQPPEQVPDAYGLEVSDLPPTCEYCNEPIPLDKRADSRFCSDAHRVVWHRRHGDVEADDYAEAIEFRNAILPPLPPDAPEDWVFERALLREAVNELHQRRRYWRRLEEWLLAIWESRVSSSTFEGLKDWRSRIAVNRHQQTAQLMRPSDHDHHRRRP
jgi:hypothetical protein